MAVPTLSGNNPFLAPSEVGASPPSDVVTFDNDAEGSFKGIALWCTTMRKTHSSAVARHRYPNVPGQTIEPMGREPIMVEIDTAWFGSDWQDRLETLVFTKDAEQTSGRLVLPGGRGEFDAFLIDLDESLDLVMLGASVTLRFEEDAHVTSYMVFAPSELSAAEQAIPASQLACVNSFDEYDALVNATSPVPAREVFAALAALETACTTAQAGLDVTTQAGVSDHLALTRVRYHARMAFPDPDFLQAALT